MVRPLLGLAVLFQAGLAVAQTGASATARIRPELIGIGQTVEFTLEAQGTGLRDLQLDPQFSLDNLEIVSGPSQSQTWQFVNGRASRAESLSWRLRAKEVGAARVTQIVLKVNGEAFELADQVIQVQRDPVATADPFGRSFADPFEDFPFSGRRPRATRDSEPKLFLRAEISPAEAYAGQQVLYTLYLFTQADVGAIDPETVPDFAGFWVEDVPQPEKLRPEMVEIQGQRYGRVVLLRKAVFPMRPGEFELEPVQANLIVSMPEYTWLGSVIPRKREISRTSNPVTLTVRALPEAPPGFRGAVGRMELSATLEPNELEVGAAATLTIRLDGQGNLQGLQPPELPILEGIRVFPPEQSSRSHVSGTRVQGEKTWTHVLVPDRAGEWQLPPLSLDYFDPFAESFEVARTAAETLTARDPLGALPSVSLGEVQKARSEVAASGKASPSAASRFRDPKVLAGGAALAATLLLVPLVLRVRKKTHATKALCARLRGASGAQRGRKAAEIIEDAWRRFLEERYDLATDATAVAWTRHLRDRGLSGSILEPFGKLIEDLEHLRYAPELSASESLVADVIDRSLKLSRSFR